MTQQTSIESYRKLKDERVLNQRLWEALEFIIKNERVVARSIPNAGWKRCSALMAMGLIKYDGVAFDEATIRSVKVWVPTGVDAAQVKKPEAAPKPESQVTDEMLDVLEDKIELLEQKQKDLTEKLVKLDEANRMLHLALMDKTAQLEALTTPAKLPIIRL